MKFLFIAIWIILLFSSCNGRMEKRKTVFPFVTQFQESTENVNLSDLFTKCKLVKLETNDSCLIGRNGKILKRDSVYYIQSGNDILAFDSEGSFKKKLSQVGSAPHEYVQLYDFDVMSIDGISEVWISTYGGIKIYDAKTFMFKKEIPMDGHVNQFKYVNDSTIIIVTPDDVVFKIYDIHGNMRKEYMDKDLANCGKKIVQFTSIAGKILYQLDDTGEAVIYDELSDSMNTEYIIPNFEKLLTVDINREYFERYGYIKQPKEISEFFIRLSSIRVCEDDLLLTTKYPDGKNRITLCKGGKCRSYDYFPEAIYLKNNIVETTDMRFLSTLICCDSDSGFLFMVPSTLLKNDEKEDNPFLLDMGNLR